MNATMPVEVAATHRRVSAAGARVRALDERREAAHPVARPFLAIPRWWAVQQFHAAMIEFGRVRRLGYDVVETPVWN